MKTRLATLVLLLTISHYGITQSGLNPTQEIPLKSDYNIILYSVQNSSWIFTSVKEFYEELNYKGKPLTLWSSSKDSIIGIPPGIVYETPINTPVYATDDGKVSEIKLLEGKNKARKGYLLTINHNKKVNSQYFEIDNILVKNKEKISKGQLLGYTANDEFVFQFMINGKPTNPPNYFFEQEKSLIKIY